MPHSLSHLESQQRIRELLEQGYEIKIVHKKNYDVVLKRLRQRDTQTA